MLLGKLYRDSYILIDMLREKGYYSSIERYNISYILEVKLHILNVLVSHFISLIGSSAIHMVTVYF